MTRATRFTLALAVFTLVSGCSSGPTRPSFDFAPFVASNPRSIVVAPVAGPDKTPGWALSIIAQPLAERGYYVLPVRMTNEILIGSGFTPFQREAKAWIDMNTGYGGHVIANRDSYQEAIGQQAIKIAEFTGVDAVLFLQVLDWNHTINTSGGVFSNMVDEKMDHMVGIDYQLVDKQGQTIWRADRHFSFTRGGGNIFTEVWNAATKPSDDQIDMLLARDVNRATLEGRKSKLKVLSFSNSTTILVGPYHPRYEADRVQRRPAQTDL